MRNAPQVPVAGLVFDGVEVSNFHRTMLISPNFLQLLL